MSSAPRWYERALREGIVGRYFHDPVIDIGCGNFLIPNARGWDVADGDAHFMRDVPDGAYATVFSSHCIEHLAKPLVALRNWWRILKPGGHLVIVAPDEDLYEQGYWPSEFNTDHRWTFTLSKGESWSPDSLNLVALVEQLPQHKLLSARICDEGYDYERESAEDQTPTAECNLEVIVQKAPSQHVWTANYKRFLKCPACGWCRIEVEGVPADGADNIWRVRCRRCHSSGSVETKIFHG